MIVLEDVKCFLESQNTPLPYYNEHEDLQDFDTSARGRVKSSYVKCIEDQEFAITICPNNFKTSHPETSHLCIRFSIDGVIHEPKYNAVSVDKASSTFTCLLARKEARVMEQKLKFAKLAVTEDGVANNTPVEELGEIKVLCYRYQATGREPNPGVLVSQDVKESKVHEKQLKGRDIGHVVGLGAAQEASKPTHVFIGAWIDSPKHDPYLTFRFLYRSERALKGLGLIPRTPSPAPSPEPTAAIPAETSELTREQLLAENALLRGQLQSTPAPQSTRAKRERSGSVTIVPKPEKKTPKKRRTAGLVTIDLTDD